MTVAEPPVAVPVCLGCMWVLVSDGPLSCDEFPAGIPADHLKGCESMDVEEEDAD